MSRRWYHGTPYREFAQGVYEKGMPVTGRGSGDFGQGLYLTTDKDWASEYAFGLNEDTEASRGVDRQGGIMQIDQPEMDSIPGVMNVQRDWGLDRVQDALPEVGGTYEGLEKTIASEGYHGWMDEKSGLAVVQRPREVLTPARSPILHQDQFSYDYDQGDYRFRRGGYGSLVDTWGEEMDRNYEGYGRFRGTASYDPFR